MSEHTTLSEFLKTLQNDLDKLFNLLYHTRTRLRVEQELISHAETVQKEVSASAKPKALPVVDGQGGPELFPGTSKEKSRSQKAAETVRVRGGRMEVPHGRS